MSSAVQRQVEQHRREIDKLHKRDADLAKKEASTAVRINHANAAANRAKSVGTVQSKLREVERLSRQTDSIRNDRSSIARKLSDQTKKLHDAEGRLSRDNDRQQRRFLEEQRRQLREQQQIEQRLRDEIATFSRTSAPLDSPRESDFFISHASEDKDGFVHSLAETLRERGCVVWYDDFVLKPGDSLRRSIDDGLAHARFGIVVLSKHFFRKEWPQRELDGLVAREVEGQIRIVPIWHEISKDEVTQHSPTLADKVALNSSLQTVDEIADNLHEMLGRI